MSLLLTCHVDQYCIDVPRRVRTRLRPDGARAARLEPLAQQLTVETIMLDDQDALHRDRLQ